jgi:hypothetical protein
MFRKISGGFPKQLGVERGVRPSFLTVTVQLVLFGLFRLSRLSVGLISWFGELGLLSNRQISLALLAQNPYSYQNKEEGRTIPTLALISSDSEPNYYLPGSALIFQKG